jgi:hypothetical protein
LSQERSPREQFLEEFSAFHTTSVVDEYTKKINKSPTPEFVYHYTDGSGLKGIFESGHLWSTDIFDLNDISEIRHGVGFALELLGRAALDMRNPQRVRAFLSDIKENLTGRIESSSHYFVCCFSTCADDLGQWRAYADDGHGYALGFETHPLERLFYYLDPQTNATFPLSYDDAVLHDMQSRLVTQALELATKFHAAMIAEDWKRLAVSLSVHIVHCSLYFKHRGYRNEEEYRFLTVLRGDQPLRDAKTRMRPYALIRYREFDWRSGAAGALRKIIIGPAADEVTAAAFVEDCRRIYLGDDHSLELTRSAIPYRSVRRGS